MRVVIVEGEARTVQTFDRPELRVGRALDNEIQLTNALVSRHHCRLELAEGQIWIEDLESANGTQVNGAKVRRKSIEPGDEVRVGTAQLSLEEDQAPFDSAHEGTEPGLATVTGEELHVSDEMQVLARVGQALLAETELAPLLKLIVDSALSLSGGERGFILLTDRATASEATPSADTIVAHANASSATQRSTGSEESSSMRVRVARLFDGSDIPVPSSRLSQGIAARVVQSGRGLLSVDASRDERFQEMASVEDLKLRSVVCVPVTSAGRVEGVLYVDNRLQQGVFEREDLERLELLANHASLAIRNARLLAELRERNERLTQSAHKIQQLNDRLGRKIRDRDTELAVVRAELGRERGRYDYTAIVGASDGMRAVFQQLDRIVESELPVLIAGESGTGKELIARAIHFNGPRADRPFVVENCAALPDTLLESELFGHTRGAFTGADRSKKGLIEQADGGTLFLDEIGDMSPEMQKKLLRVLQEGEVRPLGSDRRVEVNIRLLAASNRDLEVMVRAGEFREDLFYRVNVLTMALPPLRERREDVPLLADALLARAAREAGRPVPHLPHEVQASLTAYDWPGNVRELENEMRRLVVLAEGSVSLDLLSPNVREASPVEPAGVRVPDVAGDLRAAVASFERRAIEDALERANGNKSRAASALGISRFALQRKLEKYGLVHADEEAVDEG